MSTKEEKSLAQHMKEVAEKRMALHKFPDNVNVTASQAVKTLSEMLGLSEKDIETEASEPHETKEEGLLYFNDEDLENKTYIVRIEVRDNETGEKSEKGKIKFSKVDGTIKMNADAGMTEASSPVKTAHGIFFTHMIQATREFIEDELDGDN